MITEYFVEVPNTNIKESVASLDDSWGMCYDLAQQFGHAQVVWYALNGTRAVSYTHLTLPTNREV